MWLSHHIIDRLLSSSSSSSQTWSKYYIYSAMLLSDERVEDGLEIKFDHKVYYTLSSLDSVNTSESVF